ncbi:MAG: ABC transporter substrate-binding protein [Arcobacter sp.]|uniref:ABC transporter substrate-binding protein n=1 Tax=Arcobacter sp. TaxID=1872629 RepID=UPI002588D934|nr:ABC transporter substrate-binding protein [Arcobacter sp.]MDD3008050.1 ABC transporter substrate-binding protein [Arcobacter sp.]
MIFIKKLKFFILLLLLISTISHSKELKKVTLHLSWLDQFQFAGYYMAKEKGFYEEAGLDVEIIPFSFGVDIPKEVSDGKIDFAVGRETLILERTKDRNIVALYALFQATPLILISTKESNINSIEDFSNKKIMTTIDDASEVSIKAMIVSNKVKLENLKFLKHTHNINDLINKNTDVISAYISKAPYELQKKGIEYNVFDPKKFGFDMYSDMLYTSENLINNDLNTVLLFKKASLKGWEYAYSNIEESANLIIEKYNTQNLKKNELIYEAKELRKLSYFNTANLGEIKKDKIQRIYDLYNLMGLIQKPVDLNKFVFDLNNLRNLTFSDSEKKYLEQRDIITMCVVPNAMPYSDIKDEKFVGFVADFISLIEERIKKPIRLVQTSSWHESLESAKSKKCDILSSAVWTKDREEYLSFTKPYLNIPLVLLTKSDTSFINNLSSLKKKKISVIENYAIIKELEKKYEDIEFIPVKNIDEGIKKILDGETFGHVDAISTSWYKIQTKYLSKISISAKLDESMDIAIAVNHDDNILYGILQKAVLSIDDLVKNEMLNKWIFTEHKKEFDYSIIWKISLGLMFIFIAILYRQKLLKKLNLQLQKAVDEKTKKLTEINLQLEDRIKKEVEENLKKDRLLSQQQKMVSMGQMIENIAHQWRQPLSLITTNASGMKLKKEMNDLDEEFFYKTLDSILNTSKYLSNTIDDFRYFFKPQKDKEDFYLEKCCKKTLDLLSANFIENRIKIIDNIQNIKICGYETELIQVLINILNNSKDALLSIEDEERLIFIDITKENGKAVIRVKDNAGGIEPSIIEKVFQPYFTTKHQHQGTGIGLYMCQEIINKHMDGYIDISNTEFEYENKKYKGTLLLIVINSVY